MLFRAMVLLVAAVSLSVAATLYFGQEVLIALGLILTQAKVIAKKVTTLELPLLLAWLKTQASAFFKFELIKKWLMTYAVPLIVGNAALRRLAAYLKRYSDSVRARYDELLAWYGALKPVEKVLSALIVLFAMLALSVTSLGLWLILFSVKLPFWLVAAGAALWRSVWLSIQKMSFKAVAFLQLAWLWRLVRRVLPESWLERKRRFDYRVARAVIRRRRMTIRQLADRKDSLPFRIGLLIDYFRGGS